MYKIIKNNQKKFMAFFAVALMVAFTLTGMSGSGQNSRGDAAFGTIGSDDFPVKLVQQAHSEWEYLRGVRVDRFDSQSQQVRPISILVAELGDPAASRITTNPEMYALLIEEARRMGVAVSDEMVKARLTNIQIPLDTDGQPEPAALAALKNLFLVTGAFDRIAAAAHASSAFREMQHQQLMLRQEAQHYRELEAQRQAHARAHAQVMKNLSNMMT